MYPDELFMTDDIVVTVTNVFQLFLQIAVVFGEV